MITANVLHRVFRIRYGDSEGTGFTIEVSGKEYLVTAKHVVEALDGKETISIFSNGDWSHLEVTLAGHSPEDADISVLAAARILTPQGLPMEASTGGLIYGQDVYFLGFPYGYTGSFVFTDGGYPLPFVKKATVSLLERKTMILDGHNNPGFSGGPVVYTEPNKNDFMVAGVISGYRIVDEPVLHDGQKTGFIYKYNTGFIEADGIIWAKDLIQANPIGQTVP